MNKACPIIYAGMLANIAAAKEGYTFAKAVSSSYCLKEGCELYEHGCPAHPLGKEATKKIQEIW